MINGESVPTRQSKNITSYPREREGMALDCFTGTPHQLRILTGLFLKLW
jgi:hypothetical protein